jgi:hypothetical protein
MQGRLATGIMGFGRLLVNGLNLVPFPPAMITALKIQNLPSESAQNAYPPERPHERPAYGTKKRYVCRRPASSVAYS